MNVDIIQMCFASVYLQDTVVALQALAYYAAFSGANAIDLRLNISAPTSSFVSLFQINSTNYRTYQSQEVAEEYFSVENHCLFIDRLDQWFICAVLTE